MSLRMPTTWSYANLTTMNSIVANQFGGLNKRVETAMQSRDSLLNIINVSQHELEFRQSRPPWKVDYLKHKVGMCRFVKFGGCFLDSV